MIYLELFLSYIQIGLLSIGGGYAAIPIIQSIAVDTKGWLSLSEFTDLITIAEMTPGPIAINSSTFIGLKVAGFWGAIVATAGFLLPTVSIVLTLGILYYKFRQLEYVSGVLSGLRPAITALIAGAGISILIMSIFGTEVSSAISSMSYGSLTWSSFSVNILSIVIFTISFALLRIFKKLNPILVILGSGVLGVIVYFISLLF